MVSNMVIKQIFLNFYFFKGNVNVVEVEGKAMKFGFCINDEKIVKISFTKNHLLAAGEHTIKHFELNGNLVNLNVIFILRFFYSGTELSEFIVENVNGTITDFDIDGRNLIASKQNFCNIYLKLICGLKSNKQRTCRNI